MERLWQYLRFAPSIALVLLLVVWVIGSRFLIGYQSNQVSFDGQEGSLSLSVSDTDDYLITPGLCFAPSPRGWQFSFGHFHYLFGQSDHFSPTRKFVTDRHLGCPISFVILLLLPLAVGCRTKFRFRLWMYFAWIAMFAVCAANWQIISNVWPFA